MEKRIRRVAEEQEIVITPPAQQYETHKPIGMWYSVGEEWKEWCEGEDFHVECLKVAYEVEVNLDKMLVLRTTEDIKTFSMNYGIPRLRGYGIDWPRVAAEYDGIEIAPHNWECRYGNISGWYSSWDVASGCIWGPDALLSVKLMEGDNA